MNPSLWLLIAGSLVLVVPGVWVKRRARHEFEEHDRLSTQTFVVRFVALGGHTGITLLAAWNSMWPLPIDRRIGLLTGGVAAAVGATVPAAGHHNVLTLGPTGRHGSGRGNGAGGQGRPNTVRPGARSPVNDNRTRQIPRT